jgi:ring-1,2-phenylacetyl-CoA epoxidase subunit PaaC
MTSIPDSHSLVSYVIHLADNSLILAQRNAAWCGHGPVLEQDIAITNISLDLIGQARYFYQYAADLINKPEGASTTPASEDTLAYLRDAPEFRNCLLVEQLNGDWAQTILRQFFFSAYQYLLYQELQNSKDEQLSAIAAKSLKEVTYHLRWSSEWVIRLGDGTRESHDRLLNALSELWPYTGEFFMAADFELQVAGEGKGINSSVLKNSWTEKIREIFSEATIPVPEEGFQQSGGKTGKHSELLGYILAELQFMQRAYPDAIW